LADLGELTLKAKTDEVPPITEMDATELYMSWELRLISDASEEDIREVFEWVEDECKLEIVEVEQTTKPVENRAIDGADNPIAEEPEAIDSAPTLAASSIENSVQALEKVDKNKVKSKQDLGSIRVGVDKVDSLINLMGELVITQSMLSELGNDFELSKLEKLKNGLAQLLQNTKELQESVMKIRMLPISFAFNRFPRLVHDLSIKTGKEINLVIRGEQTELDKTVMEQIGDPLVHLVRNAVDHGIESSDVRIANGKPKSGTITLDAYHQGGNIVIEIGDDGGGINREAVLSKAIEKGLVDSSATLNDNQVFDLLFEPGFSTAKEVSDISGRGVGMDVVKRNIQSLGGRIQVESEPGKGSKFKVNLPLTLAILDGQLVRVGTEVYIIPLITIVESLQAKAEFINKVSGDMTLYRLREDNVPVIPIYQLFDLPADTKEVDNALLVVVEADGQKVGLMVDDLLAQQQVVIKSLKDNYQQVEGISGATILGDGSVAMIIDVPGMIEMAIELAQAKQSGNTLDGALA
jgi:two-component system chemotaxis sensor kinase CheA